jgi:arylsulfatase A-like enzyme
MHRQLATVMLCMVVFGHPAPAGSADTPPRPNFVFIFCDNLGYGDVGCFGSKLHRTPHIDRMAREGIKFTSFYATKVIEFITRNRDKPFFVYLPQAMPGSTRAPFASEAFRGKSANGPWGDSVEELDWSTGEILAALERLELDENTLVVWTNDNGAPQRNPPQGSNLPLAGWGYTTSEVGQRVPCAVRSRQAHAEPTLARTGNSRYTVPHGCRSRQAAIERE